MLNLSEYLLAKFLIYARENGITIPRPLPQSLLDSVTEMGIYENGEDEGDEDMASPHPWAISSRCLLAYKKLFLEHKTMISGTSSHLYSFLYLKVLNTFRRTRRQRFSLGPGWMRTHSAR